MIRCGFCTREIHEDEAESCWLCGGPLCDLCWDEVGHCGHRDADRIDREIRRELREKVPL